jgi:hypothetical protein
LAKSEIHGTVFFMTEHTAPRGPRVAREEKMPPEPLLAQPQGRAKRPGGFFIFLARNRLTNPDSEKLMKGNERKFTSV